MMYLLLISNSTNAGEPYFHHAKLMIGDFLGEKFKDILFIPYAAISFSYEAYENMVNEALRQVGLSCTSIHRYADPIIAVNEAAAIMIGGGNSFKLLSMLYHYHLIEPIKNRAMEGVPYIGWSAGANVACKTIRTTNDMPVVEPPSLEAIGLVPFQINPHYTEKTIPNHGGESRKVRLLEFIAENPNVYVVGLPEGAALRVENAKISLLGGRKIKVFRKLEEEKELGAKNFLDFLFHP